MFHLKSKHRVVSYTRRSVSTDIKTPSSNYHTRGVFQLISKHRVVIIIHEKERFNWYTDTVSLHQRQPRRELKIWRIPDYFPRNLEVFDILKEHCDECSITPQRKYVQGAFHRLSEKKKKTFEFVSWKLFFADHLFCSLEHSYQSAWSEDFLCAVI